jgi:hypothetical protein
MTSPTPAEQVDSLLDALDGAEPVSFDLGTPELPDVGAIEELVDMGAGIVPLLLERIGTSQSMKRIAYIVLVLNRIGDIRALAPLLDLCARYGKLDTKDEWHYAVIGQCNAAIERLSRAGQKT